MQQGKGLGGKGGVGEAFGITANEAELRIEAFLCLGESRTAASSPTQYLCHAGTVD